MPTPISRSIRPTPTRRRCSRCRASSSRRAEIIVEQGEIREETYGKTLHVAPEYDRDVETDIQRWFEESYSIQWRNYPVDDTTSLERARDRVPMMIGSRRWPKSVPHSESAATGFTVVDTFAEAFPMTAARVIVTTDTAAWAVIAGQTMTGYATSVIGCDAEAGIERVLAPDETPDGRPGVSVLVFAFSRDALEKAVVESSRPVRDDLPDDGLLQRPAARRKDDQRRWQTALLRRRLADLQVDRRPALLANPGDGWRVPLRGDLRHGQRSRRRQHHSDGERTRPPHSRRPRRRSSPCGAARTSILPFPGGIARSGSKVGSKYKKLRASTNTAFAPTLRGVVTTEMPATKLACAYEIVIDGLSLEAVERATARGCRPRIGIRRAWSLSLRATTAVSSGHSISGFMMCCSDIPTRLNRHTTRIRRVNTPKRLPTIGQTASRPSQWITSKPGQSWDMQTMSDSEETANADPAMSRRGQEWQRHPFSRPLR